MIVSVVFLVSHKENFSDNVNLLLWLLLQIY